MSKIIRCMGNTTTFNSRDASVTVHISMCNMTSSNDSVGSGVYYDSAGALKFTVTVIMVYGVAVIGVFALGLLKRKKRNKEHEFDKEAQMFMKDYDDIKRNFEQQSRVGAVSSLLHHIHRQPAAERPGPGAGQGVALLNNLAFLALPLSKIQEENETSDDTPEDSSNSGGNGEEFGPTCVFCVNPLDKDDNVGPLCDYCVNKYKDTVELDTDEIVDDNLDSDNMPLTQYKRFEADEIYKRHHEIPSITSDFTCSTEVEELPTLEDEVFAIENEEEYKDVLNDMRPKHLLNVDEGIWQA